MNQIYFADNKAREEHGRLTLNSAAIVLSARMVNGVIQVGSILFLARLLTPEDYGLVGMVIAITGFAPVLVDLGTRDAVVQRDHITTGEVSALFWLTMGTGLLFSVLVAACGPLFAWFYGEPRLTLITAVSSLTFITTALTCQHSALLRRAMMFHSVAKVDIAANLLSVSIIIAMAYYGFEYWALVTRSISVTLLTAAGLWYYCRWLPGKPTMTTGVKEMVGFGFHLVGSSLTEYAGKNCDRVAIGKVSGAHALGLYQNAVLVYSNILDLAFSLHDVAISALSKLKDDRAELVRMWAKALSMLAFFGMPGFGLLAVTSKDLIVVLLGAKWASAGVLLSVLALRGIPHVAERSIGWLHVAAGRTDRWMRWGIIATCAQFVALFAGLPFGTMGVATAYVICMFILFVPAIAYAGRPLGIGVGDVVRAVRGPLVGSLVAVGAGFLLRDTHLAESGRLTRVAVLTISYLAVYGIVVVGFFRIYTPLIVAISVIETFLPAQLLPWKRKVSSSNPSTEKRASPETATSDRLAPTGQNRAATVNERQPLVSILIPAYNVEKWIAESIQSALNQTWPRKEIIVVDDGSTDQTVAVAQTFASRGVKIVSQANQGAAAARNRAFSVCQGDYIQWLDADDILDPHKVASQMKAVEHSRGSHKLLSSAWGSFYHRPRKAVFAPSPLWSDQTPVEWLLAKMGQNCFMQTATWLVSRELTEAAGSWDTRMLGDDDGEYFCRVLLASEGVRFVPESKVYYRLPGTYSLSYVGHSRRKIEAQFLSCRLHIAYIRSLEDSERVRAACREFLEKQLVYCHPGLPEHFEQARQLAASLDGEFKLAPLNWRYAWIREIFGWGPAMRARNYLPHLKRSLNRSWDKALFRLEKLTTRPIGADVSRS